MLNVDTPSPENVNDFAAAPDGPLHVTRYDVSERRRTSMRPSARDTTEVTAPEGLSRSTRMPRSPTATGRPSAGLSEMTEPSGPYLTSMRSSSVSTRRPSSS